MINPSSERIESSLLDHSTHFLVGDITEQNIADTIKWIVHENLKSKKRKILTLYVNSPGGELYQAFALIDIMKASRHLIKTIGLGQIMSSAFLIFASGHKGHRYIAPHTGIMCHQHNDTIAGTYDHIQKHLQETNRNHDRMLQVLQDATGLDIDTIKTKIMNYSDEYINSTDLIDLGVADHIL